MRRSDGIGEVKKQQVVLLVASTQPRPAVREVQCHAAVAKRAIVDSVQVPARQLDDRQIQFNERDPLDAAVLEQLAQRAAVSAADDRHVYGLQIATAGTWTRFS